MERQTNRWGRGQRGGQTEAWTNKSLSLLNKTTGDNATLKLHRAKFQHKDKLNHNLTHIPLFEI